MEISLVISAVGLGLASGFHCIGMCGPIALSLGITRKQSVNFYLQNIIYQLGRVVSYAFLGGIFGLLGEGFSLIGFQRYLTIFAGLMLILMSSFSLGNNDFSNKIPLLQSFLMRIKINLGKYLKKEITCRNCNNIIQTYEEKETDVRIATQIINDVYNESCDISIIVSADSDIIPSVELIKEINPNHKIFVYFPPLRYSVNLSNSCDGEKKLANFKARFNKSMLPDEVILPKGTKLSRPENWK